MNHVNMDNWKKLYHDGTEVLALQHDDTCIWAKEQTISGDLPLSVIPRQPKSIKDWTLYGKTVQNGTPTPDAPIDIQGVGDRTANLLPIEPKTVYVRNVKVTLSFNEITLQGTASGSGGRTTKLVDDFVLPAGTYHAKTDGNSSTAIFFLNKASDSSVISQLSNHVITLEQDTKVYVGVNFVEGGVYNETGITIMLNTGSTALPYEPYGYKVTTTNKGKNLFEHPVYSEATSQGLTFTPIENGMLSVSGTPTGYTSFALCSTQKIPANLIGQPVTFNFVIRDIVNLTWGGITIYDENQTILYQYQGGSYAPHKITIPDNADTMTATVKRINNGVVTSGVIGLMLNLGSTATAYEPYREPITTTLYTDKPLYGTGTNLDYLQRLADGSGVEHRAFAVKVFDGSEEWNKGNYPPTGGYQFFTPKPSGAAGYPDWLITHFKNRNEVNGSAFGSYLSLYPEVSILPENATANDFKAWLAAQYAAGTPVTILYQLATPTDTPVTLPAIATAEGTNVLDTNTTVKPSQVSVKTR